MSNMDLIDKINQLQTEVLDLYQLANSERRRVDALLREADQQKYILDEYKQELRNRRDSELLLNR